MVSWMSRKIVPSAVIWGVTCSSSTASTNWTLVPRSEAVSNGIRAPSRMFAERFVTVVIDGAAMILLVPLVSPAVSRASRLIIREMDPKLMPIDPLLEAPGRSTT